MGSAPRYQADAATIATALKATLTPQGDTEITQALREALDELKGAPEEIRHIVLFTDGWGNDTNLLSVSQEIADAGITLSVLGTGEGSGENAAKGSGGLGGGQFYPGRDLQAIPDIFIEETLRVAQASHRRRCFPAQPRGGVASHLGPHGYPGAAGLRADEEQADGGSAAGSSGPGDPLFATWQRGLGRAAVWTSDATRPLVGRLGRAGTDSPISGAAWSPMCCLLDAIRRRPSASTAARLRSNTRQTSRSMPVA